MKPLRDKNGNIAAIPAAKRFLRMVDTSAGPLGCWPFLAATQKGYGAFHDGEKRVAAHRYAWRQVHGDYPSGHIDHVCHDPTTCEGGMACPHRRCCNPAHMVDTSLQANNARGRRRTKADRTHCPEGHPFNTDNTYMYRGARLCRTCRAKQGREWRAKRTAKADPVASSD